MLKLGLTAPSARTRLPTVDEQTQMLLHYGVSAENIYNSKAELLTRVATETDPVEVVVTSLSRWGVQVADRIEGLALLQERSGSLTVLGPTEFTLIGWLWLGVFDSEEDVWLEGIAGKKRGAATAARSREIPIGPTPKLSQADVDWIWTRREEDNWGPDRIVSGLKRDRNIAVSKRTVMRVLGLIKGAAPYVPRDNHKYLKRDAERRG
ncbi:hypothetical protein [Microbacterium sp. 13-71-7]|uniref:hypothetical protein n=1 Tax=Microbacterium sp. 13-71-7 TaxID=1970399 RepID=UPI0025FE25B2|nr:hypothetical protein [Microbacterium sp. 13-71-7]